MDEMYLIEDFKNKPLEIVDFSELDVGDIFSFSDGKHRHVFIRKVTKKIIAVDSPKNTVIHFNVISREGYGRTDWVHLKSHLGLVTRIKNCTEYDPEQQPYTEDDI